MLEEAQEVLRRVAQNTKSASTVQMVCDHPPQTTALQAGIMIIQRQVVLPPECNHTESKTRCGLCQMSWTKPGGSQLWMEQMMSYGGNWD